MNGRTRRVLRHPVLCGGIFLCSSGNYLSGCKVGNLLESEEYQGDIIRQQVHDARGQKCVCRDGVTVCVFQFAATDDTSATRRNDLARMT